MTALCMRTAVAAALLLSIASCGGGGGSPPTPPDPSMVGPTSIDDSWFLNDTRDGGTVSFSAGPEIPPRGVGSLRLQTTDTMGGSSQAKAQFFNYTYAGDGNPGTGVLLSELTHLSYYCFRDGASTNPAAQTIALNIEVDFVGDGSSFTTLVFEPIYNAYQQPLLTDVWQAWDAIDGGDGIWWSTQAIPGVCAFSCYVDWATILANNPNARVLGGLGFNCGSGWSGEFDGAVDALTVGVNGTNLTYDFEP